MVSDQVDLCAVDKLRTLAVTSLMKIWKEVIFPSVEDPSGASALNLS